MKVPALPPSLPDLINKIGAERLPELFSSGIGRIPQDKYLHWANLKYLKAPEGYSNEEWWFATKAARRSAAHTLPFLDKNGRPFWFCNSAYLYRMLLQVDRDASGTIELPADVANTDARNRYLVNSLIEEAITSSQLEGAATSRLVAKDLLRSGRRPRDRSERMIFNNYLAMGYMRDLVGEDLSIAVLLELQSVLTDETVDDPDIVGRFRTSADSVRVVDQRDGTVLHDPPDAHEIDERMERLIRFANTTDESAFIHPVVRAMLLHFMIGYDHPFVDGNGRTARALFYWAMAKSGYWMTEFLSISNIIRKAPVQYARAYVYAETEENDVTYFLDYHLRVILGAIRQVHGYLAQKAREINDVQRLLDRFVPASVLNYRQVAMIMSMRKHPERWYTIQGHRRSHNVTYQTARTDLLKLVELRLVAASKRGREFVFRLADDFDERLRELADSAG